MSVERWSKACLYIGLGDIAIRGQRPRGDEGRRPAEQETQINKEHITRANSDAQKWYPGLPCGCAAAFEMPPFCAGADCGFT